MSDATPPQGADERSRFLSTISHDLRTPLTALRGALGLLERKELPPEMVGQLLSMLRRASDRLERLTLGLITIDLIDNGTMSVLTEVVDLREVVEDVVAVLKREHELVEVTLPDAPVYVTCDRERALQALDHVLDNARKFGGPEGTVRVEVTTRAGRGVVTIADEGPGIPPEHRTRVFERYLQIGERLPNEPRGAGIGLYLARWNAEAMGGALRVAEGDSPGAVLELTLPLADEPRSTSNT